MRYNTHLIADVTSPKGKFQNHGEGENRSKNVSKVNAFSAALIVVVLVLVVVFVETLFVVVIFKVAVVVVFVVC